MKLKETILKEHSKANCNRIVKWIGNNQEKFDELFFLFTGNEYRVIQRAAWPVSYCIQMHPQLIRKHFSRLLKNLENTNVHVAVKRNTIRLLQYVTIPKKFHGQVMNLCFGYISTPGEAAAVKAFSLTVLQNLAKQYPEISHEIKLVIDERWDYESAAFKARARKLIKELA